MATVLCNALCEIHYNNGNNVLDQAIKNAMMLLIYGGVLASAGLGL